jgi:hypothetical protein
VNREALIQMCERNLAIAAEDRSVCGLMHNETLRDIYHQLLILDNLERAIGETNRD